VGQGRRPRGVGPAMERQSVDEERHRTSPPPSAIVTSIPDIGTEKHLGFQRLDAEDDDLLARQSLREALVIELVLVYGEVEQVLAPVGNPLPWTLGPELGQVPVRRRARPAAPSPPVALRSHLPLLLRSRPIRPRSRDPHSTRKFLSTDRVHGLAHSPPISRQILARLAHFASGSAGKPRSSAFSPSFLRHSSALSFLLQAS